MYVWINPYGHPCARPVINPCTHTYQFPQTTWPDPSAMRSDLTPELHTHFYLSYIYILKYAIDCLCIFGRSSSYVYIRERRKIEVTDLSD